MSTVPVDWVAVRELAGRAALQERIARLEDQNAALHKELEPYAGANPVGVTCLADGPDQLLARAVLGLGGKPEVAVPAEQYRDGLDPDEQRGWV